MSLTKLMSEDVLPVVGNWSGLCPDQQANGNVQESLRMTALDHAGSIRCDAAQKAA